MFLLNALRKWALMLKKLDGKSSWKFGGFIPIWAPCTSYLIKKYKGCCSKFETDTEIPSALVKSQIFHPIKLILCNNTTSLRLPFQSSFKVTRQKLFCSSLISNSMHHPWIHFFWEKNSHLTACMINLLHGNELGAEGHDINVGIDRFVLLQNLWQDDTLSPPGFVLENLDTIFGSSYSHRIFTAIEGRNKILV